MLHEISNLTVVRVAHHEICEIFIALFAGPIFERDAPICQLAAVAVGQQINAYVYCYTLACPLTKDEQRPRY